MAQVREFLTNRLKLRMSEEKSKIAKATDGARFLGYDVVVYTAPCRWQITRNGRAYTARSATDVLQLQVPWEKVAKFCANKEYGDWEHMRAAPKLSLIHCRDAEIVMAYNAEIRGLAAYYALAKDVRKKLNKLAVIWSRSLGFTLARKHKCTVTNVFDRLRCGRDYVVRYEVKGKPKFVRLWRQRDPFGTANPRTEVDDHPNTAVFVNRQKRSILAIFVKDRCEVCNTKNVDCETHTLRYLANVSGRTAASLTPKTHTRLRIYVCAPCLTDLRLRRSAEQG